MAGVNNLSIGRNATATPKYDNWDHLVRDIVQELYQARIKIDTLAREVVICDMIGMHFQNCNYGLHHHAYPYHQWVLDRATVCINKHIHEMNEDRGLNSPQETYCTQEDRGEQNQT